MCKFSFFFPGTDHLKFQNKFQFHRNNHLSFKYHQYALDLTSRLGLFEANVLRVVIDFDFCTKLVS